MRQSTNSRCLGFEKERMFKKRQNDYIKMSDLRTEDRS
jgi:hypothetical protein